MKINIVGAGISGLSVGSYLQMNGFETEIFEKQSRPGGLCTSWERGDYTFDGCIHWLLGSNDSSPFFRLWSELIDMNSVEFINHDVRVEIELNVNLDRYGSNVFHLYTNLVRLEAYLLDIAPEDAYYIKGLVRSMRIIQQYEVPPLIDRIMSQQPLRKKMAMITYLPFFMLFLKWKNVTNYSFAARLSNPFLKEAFELLFDGEEFKMLILTMPLSFYDRKGAGYPVGGSYRFAKRIEEKYISLGGKINYNREVRKIITEENIAMGVLLKNEVFVASDVTISAADWHYTVFGALDGKYLNKKLIELASQQKLKLYPSVFLISLGVSKTFTEYPHFFRFPLKIPVVSPDGTEYSRLEAHIYHYDKSLAPEGKTVVAVSFYTRNGEYWINLRGSSRDEYIRQKTKFSEQIIDELDKRITGIKQSVEVVDIATPATYHRYTNNWQGSVQGWFPDRNLLASSPVGIELPGLSGFYYCSHWSVPGGGLPVAVKSARDLAQKICLKYKKPFEIR